MQQEKFITRKQMGLMDIQGGARTVSKSGRRAMGKAYDEVMQPANRSYYRQTGMADGLVTPERSPYADARNQQSREMMRNAQSERNAAITKANAKGRQAEIKKTSKVVAQRDATNTRIAKERMSGRAAASKTAPKGGGMGGALSNPMLGVAASMYEADRATGFRRTGYSGNSGGPSFTMNPYAKTNYSGQSPMSKMMGVKK